MGDHLQAVKPSRYVDSHTGHLSLAIPPWVDATSTGESWDVNRHTAWCTSPVSVFWQCKLVSGWGLTSKQRSAPPYGPYGFFLHLWRTMSRCQVSPPPEAAKLHIVPRKDRFHKLFPDVSDSDVVIKCKLRSWSCFSAVRCWIMLFTIRAGWFFSFLWKIVTALQEQFRNICFRGLR